MKYTAIYILRYLTSAAHEPAALVWRVAGAYGRAVGRVRVVASETSCRGVSRRPRAAAPPARRPRAPPGPAPAPCMARARASRDVLTEVTRGDHMAGDTDTATRRHARPSRAARARENSETKKKIQRKVLNHRALVTDPETIVVCIYL